MAVSEQVTADQEGATDKGDAAATGEPTRAWARHPLDFRISIPMPGGRVFLTVVGGREKRAPKRREVERTRYPLRTAGNLFFFVGVATLFYLVAAFSMAVQSSLIEF